MLREDVEKAGSQYDEITDAYSMLINSCFEKVNAVLDREYDKCIDAAKGKVVLDVACGDGKYTKMMLERGAELVVGVDESEQMINACRKAIGSDKVILQVGDLASFDLMNVRNRSGQPVSYDLIYTFAFWHYLPSAQRIRSTALSLARSLMPGGSLYALVLDSNHIPCKSGILNVWTELPDHQEPSDGDRINWNYIHEGQWLFPQHMISYYWRNESLKRFLEEAGLVEDFSYNILDTADEGLDEDEKTTLRVWRIQKHTKNA